MAGRADEKYADSTKQRAATVPRNLVKTWNSQKILLQFFSTESVTRVIVTNVLPQIKAYLKELAGQEFDVRGVFCFKLTGLRFPLGGGGLKPQMS